MNLKLFAQSTRSRQFIIYRSLLEFWVIMHLKTELSLGFHEILCFGHIRSQHDRNENVNLLQFKLILLQNIHLVIQQDQSDPVVLQRRSYFDFLLAKTKYNQTQCHVLQILVLQEETIKQSKRHIVKICYSWF